MYIYTPSFYIFDNITNTINICNKFHSLNYRLYFIYNGENLFIK